LEFEFEIKKKMKKIIVWEWFDDSKWVQYDENTSTQLEKNYKDKKSFTIKIYGNSYYIDFKIMKQQNESSKFQRNIQRREVKVKDKFEYNRYQTFVSLDKPIYKKGDTVFVRAIVLSPKNQKPISSKKFDDKEFYLGAELQIIGPNNDTIHTQKITKFENSVLSATYKIPMDQVGGNFKVKFVYKANGFPSAERGFEIREFQNPRLNSQLEFLKKGKKNNNEKDMVLVTK
jgi:uncharacterized protein YfaS (alpha-2-macroglobulin family)